MYQDAVAMVCRVSCALRALHGTSQVWGRLDDRLGGVCCRHAISPCDVACLQHAGHYGWCVETCTTMASVSSPTLCRVG